MRELGYLRPADLEEAVTTVTRNPRASYLAGGTNLVDHLKLGVAAPELLVDVRALPLGEVAEHDTEQGRVLRIGANVRNSDLAAHPLVRAGFPAVSRALLSGASGQIRNQATTGGNLLQRTRCVYFQDVTTPCNKRDPGSGCSAIEGYGRYNAVLGLSDACVAVHPSDLAVALAALDATLVVHSEAGERRVPFGDLHRLPGRHPEHDTTLQHGDLITAVELAPGPLARGSTYYKARDRASYAFALVSVAAALQLDGDRVADVRIAWGGVAHKPWRASRAEDALRGQPFSEQAVREAAAAELADAVTSAESAYKPAMVRATTAYVLGRLARDRGAG
jgi:xanthine dehydrogenase YagS FAD-binding subunit